MMDTNLKPSHTVFWISFLLIGLTVFLAKAHGESETSALLEPSISETVTGDTQMRSPAQAKGITLSKAVGQVDDHVITTREIKISAILDQVISSKSVAPPKAKDSWLLQENSKDFQSHLTQVFLEMVVSLEAENFSVGSVEVHEIQKFSQNLKTVTKGWSAWKNLEVSDLEIDQMIARKLRSRNFLRFKMKTSGVSVSDADAEKYFDKNRLKFGNVQFAQYKDQIKDVLSQEQMQDKLKDWFEILKRKYRVKFLGA